MPATVPVGMDPLAFRSRGVWQGYAHRMGKRRRSHPEWVMMADAGIPVDVIARLNDRSRRHVSEYLARYSTQVRGGPAPPPLVLHDQPRPRSASRPDPDRRFRARLEELEAFLATNARRPHLSAGGRDRSKGTEWSLAHWLTTARSADRHGHLPAHRARWLDRALPSWRTDDRSIEYEAHWRHTLVQLLVFLDAHGRLPKKRQHRAEPWEHQLAAWLAEQRADLQSRTLDSERQFWLDRQVPGWRHRRASPRPR